jgi:pimeloyl-ACP methyl ester carboxylesterase
MAKVRASFESANTDLRLGAYQAGESQVHYVRGDDVTTRRIPIVWCHGFSLFSGLALGQQHLQRPYHRWFEELCAVTRRPVLIAELGGGSTWANSTAQARVETLLTWAGTNLGVRTDRIVLAGESMGSLLAFNLAWRNQPRTAALYCRAPITAMDAFHDRNAVFAPLMEAAYGGLAGFNAALAANDPINNRALLAGLGPRTRLDYALSDEFIPPAEVLAHAAGTGVTEVHAQYGTHVDILEMDPTPVADWLADVLVDPIAA